MLRRRVANVRLVNPNFFPPFTVSPRPTGPRLTRRDWLGITPPLDAAIVGRVHNNPKPTSPPPTRRQSGRRKSKKRGRGRYARYAFWEDLWGDFFDYDYGQTAEEVTTQEEKSTPVQNVYFFKKGTCIYAHFQ